MERTTRLIAGTRSTLAACLLVTSVVAGCTGAGGPTRSLALPAINGSGVSGTVTLTEVSPGRTRVEISVESNGNPDMPAHIHAGACPKPIPQPQHPLTAVIAGHSVTEVPASLAELTAGDLTLNLHRSNEDLRSTTACADLR
jgi:hypothetical protein